MIAGDLHRAGGSRASVADAVASVDGERARWMVTEAPAAILAGAPLPPAPGRRAAQALLVPPR